MTTQFSILIPTRDRRQKILRLLDNLTHLNGLDRLNPEVIVGDNGSRDLTWPGLEKLAKYYPVKLSLFKMDTPGKSRVLNKAMRLARGDVFAFLDDDVVVDSAWLVHLEEFFANPAGAAVQGAIRIPPTNFADHSTRQLIDRFRTVRQVDFHETHHRLHSLNGANMAIRRAVFTKVGDFDLRLGPGASGTSEDVELAQRICGAGIDIGYAPNAVVYHELDPQRLTEAYFKVLHQRQGISRLVFKEQHSGRIFFDLCRSTIQYLYHSMFGDERKRYRSKGRIYHYHAMLSVKLGIHNPNQ